MPSEENLDDGKTTGLGKLYLDSPDLKSPMPSEEKEEAPDEEEEAPEYAKKIDINIVFNGLSGSGSSTTAGHLLYKLEGSDKSLIELIEKRIEKEGSDMSLKYALVLDHLRGQSERGMTSGIPHLKFETTKYYCTFTDEPVFNDFIDADCAVLIIDSTTAGSLADLDDHIFDSTAGGFKAGGLTGGVRPKKMICCVNKMDATTPKYSKDRYNEVVILVDSYLRQVGILRKVGINPEITFVPISGFEGDNLIERSTNLDWYNGPTLLEALDQPLSDYMISDEEPSPKLGGWLGGLIKERGMTSGISECVREFESPKFVLKESSEEEEEAPAEDAEKAAFDEAEKKREKEEESKDAPAESDAEEEAEDDDNEADDSKVI